MSLTNKQNRCEYPIVKLAEKGKILIKKELQTQILYLHQRSGKTEWSGWIVYKNRGTVFSPDVEAIGMYPMDIQEPAYTDYSPADHFNEMDEIYYLIDEDDVKVGAIHTHHTMNAYFSGVDNGEIRDNVLKYKGIGYLSVIVSMCNPWVAKVFIPGTQKRNLSILGNELETPIEEDVLFEVELEVEYESDEWLAKKTDELIEMRIKRQAEIAKKNKYKGSTSRNPFDRSYGDLFDDFSLGEEEIWKPSDEKKCDTKDCLTTMDYGSILNKVFGYYRPLGTVNSRDESDPYSLAVLYRRILNDKFPDLDTEDYAKIIDIMEKLKPIGEKEKAYKQILLHEFKDYFIGGDEYTYADLLFSIMCDLNSPETVEDIVVTNFFHVQSIAESIPKSFSEFERSYNHDPGVAFEELIERLDEFDRSTLHEKDRSNFEELLEMLQINYYYGTDQ